MLTPVMNMHMVIESWSTWIPTGTVRPPTWNQVK